MEQKWYQVRLKGNRVQPRMKSKAKFNAPQVTGFYQIMSVRAEFGCWRSSSTAWEVLNERTACVSVLNVNNIVK